MSEDDKELAASLRQSPTDAAEGMMEQTFEQIRKLGVLVKVKPFHGVAPSGPAVITMDNLIFTEIGK